MLVVDEAEGGAELCFLCCFFCPAGLQPCLLQGQICFSFVCFFFLTIPLEPTMIFFCTVTNSRYLVKIRTRYWKIVRRNNEGSTRRA